MTKEKKAPPIMGKLGRVRYKIWTNTNPKGGSDLTTVDFYRSYRSEKRKDKKDDGWREARSFSLEDLKVLPLLINEVLERLNTAKAA